MRSASARRCTRSTVAAIALAALAAAGSVAVAPRAHADTSPPDASTPATVSVDPLPTVQINGVVYAQVVVGNTVYATGSFTSARPAGSPAGTNETPRRNLLAFDIRTGALLPLNRPLNSTGRALAVSPDQSTLYIGGDFTKIDSKTHDRIAAISIATGKVIDSFAPDVNDHVNAITATASGVYFGGKFTAVSGQSRGRLAAVAPDGSLLSWAPTADNGAVLAMAAAPSGSRIVVGGQFTTVNNSGSGYGLAALDPSSGAQLPWTVANSVHNAGSNAGIFSLSTDGTQVFGTGFVFGSGGNFEGAFAADGDSGNINWMEDCHGDTYGAFAMGQVTYVVSHSHYCNNIGGFPQTSPNWTFYRSTAYTNYATGIVQHNQAGGYTDWYGQPAPTQLDWYPTLATGTYTKQNQAAWSITGNSQYLVLGGEFPTVNGVAQQGLVRFAVASLAPNKYGPKSADSLTPAVSTAVPGQVRLSWPATWDQDNEALTYAVYRNGKPYWSSVVRSKFWSLPTVTFADTAATPGVQYSYRVYVTDPFGNQTKGHTVYATATASGPPYPADVANDGASDYWRLDDTNGTTFADAVGSNPLTTSSGGINRGVTGMLGDTPGAAQFDGSSGTAGTTTAQNGPNTFSIEAWFQTTTTSGGKIVGFGNSQLGTSGSYDRHVYLDNAGHVVFGVYPGTVRTVSSPGSYNDGQWHYVVATLSPDGMVLYVDGQQVGNDPSTTTAQAYSGYWRIGGDNLNGWTNRPSSNFFGGTIDEVAIYPTALSAAQVAQHYADSGR